MSRFYEMQTEIKGYNRSKADEIIAAALEEWTEFDGDIEETRCLCSGENQDNATEIVVITGCGQGNLCGGETEEQFANRLTQEIFKANGGPCKVTVRATCMEDLPQETYEFDENKPPK
jgi:hypothetical protein